MRVLEESEYQHLAQLKQKGNELYKRGQLRPALEQYSLVLEEFERMSEQLSELGEEQFKLVDQVVIPTYLNKGLIYLKLEQHTAALQMSQKVLALNPKNIKANFRAGQALLHLGMRPEAIDKLEQAMLLEPGNQQIKKWLALSREPNGPRQAIPNPEQVRRIKLGDESGWLGRLKQAAREFLFKAVLGYMPLGAMYE